MLPQKVVLLKTNQPPLNSVNTVAELVQLRLQRVCYTYSKLGDVWVYIDSGLLCVTEVGALPCPAPKRL